MSEANESPAAPPAGGVELTITDLAFGGKGVARHEGKVFFVPFVLPGERVRVRVVRDRTQIRGGGTA